MRRIRIWSQFCKAHKRNVRVLQILMEFSLNSVMRWSVSVEKKICTLYFRARNRFPGWISVFGGRVREIWKFGNSQLWEAKNGICRRGKDRLTVKMESHNSVRQGDFRFFRTHRGRLHPQFWRFLNLETIFEGERRHQASKLSFTWVISVYVGYILCESHAKQSKCRGAEPGRVFQNVAHWLDWSVVITCWASSFDTTKLTS